MHTSLYRRFRPSTFDEMVRQEHVVRVLKNQIAQNAVGHAYLFCGPRGTGKTSVARIFARAVNCASPVNGSPCGVCPSCVALSAGGLDVVEIDAASNNGVNEMRDLREKVQYPPVACKYKVYIIDEVHMLTDSAFNALLKTLEEPPAHAIFILATTEPQKLPATILSRCMRLDFKLIPEEDLEAHLKRVLEDIGKPYEEEAVAAIARAGAGSDRDMLSIAEMCIAYSDTLTYEGVTAVLGAADFKETSALVGAILASDMPAAIATTEKILSEGKAVGVLLKDILELLNRVTVAKTCKNAEKLLSLPRELYARVKELADAADGNAILRAAEIFAAAETSVRYASSPRIALETAIMRVSAPQNDRDIEALLVRIKRLEERLAALGDRPQVAPAAQPAVQPVPVQPAPVKTEPAPRHEPEPESYPEEEPIFAEAYFSDEPIPVREAAAKEPVKEPENAPAAAPGSAPVSPAEGMTADGAYGKFMRVLRKTSRNGVLFTMCLDLSARYEGETLALYTDSETVCRALNREEHKKIMAAAFAEIGVSDFVVKKSRAQTDPTDGVEELKRNFKDYPIEIK